MGLFGEKPVCGVCGKTLGMNRYKIRKDDAWCCPDCLNKAQNSVNGKRIVNCMTITIDELKQLVANPTIQGQEKKFGSIQAKEYRMRCNVCGHVYCFTDRDLQDNVRAAKSAKLSAMGEMAGALSGNWGAAIANGQNANDARNKITDFSRCPKCNSTNITALEDGDALPQSGSNGVSAVDELKKFKELLDMGVITQEEFDAKKKQLLGL